MYLNFGALLFSNPFIWLFFWKKIQLYFKCTLCCESFPYCMCLLGFFSVTITMDDIRVLWIYFVKINMCLSHFFIYTFSCMFVNGILFELLRKL